MIFEILKNISYEKSIFLVIGLLCLFLIFYRPRPKRGFDNNTGKLYEDISLKKVLSHNELPMYHQLCQAFPKHIILCQVSFSAVLNTKNIATRNKFSRRMIDFCLVNREFTPLACVEYDDRSHKYGNKPEDDKKRDTLLNSAGIPVFRFTEVPSILELRLLMRNYV